MIVGTEGGKGGALVVRVSGRWSKKDWYSDYVLSRALTKKYETHDLRGLEHGNESPEATPPPQ